MTKTLSGKVVDVFPSPDEPYVGDTGDCGHSNWDFDDGDANKVRVAAVDLAGNVSAWSDPVTIEAGCGFSFTGLTGAPSGGNLIALIALIGLIAFSRRRP